MVFTAATEGPEPVSSTEEKDRASEHCQQQVERQKRDEYEALEAGVPDLIRLERYERRAWSRQKRALRDFMNTKLMRE